MIDLNPQPTLHNLGPSERENRETTRRNKKQEYHQRIAEAKAEHQRIIAKGYALDRANEANWLIPFGPHLRDYLLRNTTGGPDDSHS